MPSWLASPFLRSLSGRSLCSQAHRYPEIDLGAGPRFALDATRTAGQLSALAHGDESYVAGDARGLRDHEAGAVVAYLDSNPPVHLLRHDPDPCRPSVLLHVGERLGDVLHHDRLDRGRDVIGNAWVVGRLDAG